MIETAFYVIMIKVVRLCSAILLFLSVIVFSQTLVPFDSLRLRDTEDLMVDDYGGIYLFRDKNFSLKKYEASATEPGSLMLTTPYKVQSVQNPLHIPLFSENAQELRFADQNLNIIQTVDLKTFGYIKMAYAEDHQLLWLVDESTKRLIKYHFREQKILATYPFPAELSDLRDMIVYEERIYLLYPNEFKVQNLSGQTIFSASLEGAIRLRRENSRIFILSRNSIHSYNGGNVLNRILEVPGARIVDKNSRSYFAVMGNKLYLYAE